MQTVEIEMPKNSPQDPTITHTNNPGSSDETTTGRYSSPENTLETRISQNDQAIAQAEINATPKPFTDQALDPATTGREFHAKDQGHALLTVPQDVTANDDDDVEEEEEASVDIRVRQTMFSVFFSLVDP